MNKDVAHPELFGVFQKRSDISAVFLPAAIAFGGLQFKIRNPGGTADIRFVEQKIAVIVSGGRIIKIDNVFRVLGKQPVRAGAKKQHDG